MKKTQELYLDLLKNNKELLQNVNLSDMNKLSDYNSIILDVRQNTGSDDRYAARIANAFVYGKHFLD